MTYLKLNKLILFFIYLLTLTNVYSQRNSLFVIHTNNTNGALENCYCPDNPFGSMEKRSVFVRDFIKKNPNTILLDAGDFVTMSQHALKDSLIAEAYGLLPYDAILYGDQELVLDARTLNRLRGQLGTTLVGTNIDRSDFFTSKVIRRKGLRIAVMGIMDPYAIKFYPDDIKKRIRLSDPVESIKKEMKKLSKKADIFILLTHQGYDLDLELAKKIDGLDLIVGSHSQTKIESPEEVNKTLIVQAGKSGYYVGVVEIKTNKGKVVEKSGRIDTMKFDMPDDPRIMKMIEEYESKTGRMNMRKKKLKEKADG
jgi:5'-nucleotidase